MSYIDTFDHEFVGFFAGNPVYRSLVHHEPDFKSEGDFSCATNEFVVGGGGGEFPGLVVKNPNAAVSHFFRFWLEDISGLDEDTQTELKKMLPDLEAWEDVLHFCGWLGNHYHYFYNACMSPGLVTPYDVEVFGNLEDWIYLNFGELIYFSFPEMAVDVIDSNPEIVAKFERPYMNNILIQPSGYKPYGGRFTDKNGKLDWGKSSWIVNRRS